MPGTTDTATFNAAAGAGGSVIDLGGAVTVQTLAFDTATVAAYTIGTGAVGTDTLTLDNDGSITVGADVVADQTINANVVLGNTATASTYTFTNASATNSLSVAGNITGGAAAAKTLAVTGAGATNLSGIISDGSATSLAITSSDAGTLTLSGVNTYSGGTTINAGSTILADNNLALGSGTVTLTGDNAILALGDGVNVANSLITNNIGANKTLTVSGTSAEYSGDIYNGEATGAFNLNAAAGQTLTLSGIISSGVGNGDFTLNGSGTVILTGNNDFTKNLSMTGGGATVRLEHNNAAGTGDFEMRSTTTIEVANGLTVANDIVATSGGNIKTLKLETGATSAEWSGDINSDEQSGFLLTAEGASVFTISGDLTQNRGFYNVNGDGEVILSGANTIELNFTNTGGTLTLAETGSLQFTIGAAGSNNDIAGVGGILNLDGSFIFDLTGASTTVGDSWMVVDGTFTETYGNTFAVDSTVGSFTDLGGDVWGIVENGVGYEFSELTGELSVVVPEPSTYALLAGLLGLTYAMVRRRR